MHYSKAAPSGPMPALGPQEPGARTRPLACSTPLRVPMYWVSTFITYRAMLAKMSSADSTSRGWPAGCSAAVIATCSIKARKV